MSEGYQTEEEQIEAIKKWWKENGTSTLVGIALAVAAVFGWQGWQKQQQQDAYNASALYQNLISLVDQSQGPLSGEQLATATHLADTLKADFNKSTYANFAALYKAQFAVAVNDYDAAETELRWVLNQNTTEEIVAQARLRLARVLTVKKQYDEALALLSTTAPGYEALYNEQQGDVYLAQGKILEAKNAYDMAKSKNNESEKPVNNALLDLKLQQLQTSEGV